jgi:hypothetical protein
MSTSPRDEEKLLRDAKATAERLMAGLIAQSRDLDRFAGQIAPDKFAEGQQAFSHAIESTRKTLEGIEVVLRGGGQSSASKGT